MTSQKAWTIIIADPQLTSITARVNEAVRHLVHNDQKALQDFLNAPVNRDLINLRSQASMYRACLLNG